MGTKIISNPLINVNDEVELDIVRGGGININLVTSLLTTPIVLSFQTKTGGTDEYLEILQYTINENGPSLIIDDGKLKNSKVKVVYMEGGGRVDINMSSFL